MSSYSEYEKKLLDDIDTHGWRSTFVFDPDGDVPDFAYSVGFTKTLNAPEFIIFGLPKDLMHAMLWEIFRQVKAGAIPCDGKRWTDLLEGFDCISRKAQHPDLYTEYAVSADWFWRENGNPGNPEIYQIVWPGSAQGLFPWEDGCTLAVIDAQPPLWRNT